MLVEQVSQAIIVKGEVSYFSDLDSEEQETLSTLSTNQQELLDAINKERSKPRTCGDRGTFPPVPALTWNPELYAAALEHVTDLAYSNTFSHDGSGTEYDLTGNGLVNSMNASLLMAMQTTSP